MDFELSDSHKQLQQEMGDFFKNEIAPNAGPLDKSSPEEKARLVRENINKLAGIGYLGLGLDKAYGGSGLDLLNQCVAGEELAKACASTYVSARASAFLFGYTLQLFGDEAQKERYLPDMIKAASIGALAYSEQDAGSDITSIQTTAHKKDGKWVLSGTKDIVSNAPVADVFLVLAYTDTDKGIDSGMGLFLIEKGTKGLRIADTLDTMGLRGVPIAGITLDNCEVAEDALLGGEPGKGGAQIRRILEVGRLGLATMAVGMGVACMEKATEHAKNKKAFGKQIGRFQEIGFKLSDMFTDNDLGRMLTQRAAWAIDQAEEEAEILASCAKLFTGEALNRIANWAMQIFAGHGYIKGADIERLYRDARYVEIAEETTELQRVTIAKNVLDKFI